MELLRKRLSLGYTLTLGMTIIFLLAVPEILDRIFRRPWEPVTIDLKNDQRWVVSPSRGSEPHQESPARALIESIKETRRLVSGTSEIRPSDETESTKEARRLAAGLSDEFKSGGASNEAEEEELEEWERQNPCVSRLELMPMYEKRKHAKKLPPNPAWDELLVEYSKLHRACMKKVGSNLRDYFLSGNVSVAGCQFVVADIAPWTGLGNKFYVTASSVLYAILTKRVVLIPSATLLPGYTCEPFLGSSWRLDSHTFPVPRYFHNEDFNNSPWTHNTDFFSEIDELMQNTDSKIRNDFQKDLIIPAAPLKNAISVITTEWQPNNRFYCSVEQTFYSQSTWVYMSGCIHTIPKFFAAPPFRPVLEDLFPDKMVMTRLLRSLLLPADVIWGRVRRIDHAYLADADRRVGLQLRYKDGQGQYKDMNDLVNERVVNCARNYAILPDVNSSQVGNLRPENASAPPPVVKVFVASLFQGLSKHLSEIFNKFPSLTGEVVELVQVSDDLAQKMEDVEEDQQAMTEVLLLSLSDQLVITPVSTFGGLAQAFGALTPWFVEMRKESNLPPCERAQTVDVCDQFADKDYKCPYDPVVDRKHFSDVVPYIKDCLTIDHREGIQLITGFQS